MDEKVITVTSPLLPPLEEYTELLKDIWDRKWITNNGFYHKKLEKELCDFLKIDFLSLFTNGTLPLLAAFQALNLTKGEVITTAYSFVATSHSILWNKLEPVFVDVEEETGNMNPDKIEEAISERTVAILPVHVYGNPCNTKKIREIAQKHNLKLIYDAAHAFGVEVNGRSILEEGDLATLSFHATKVFNTVEGGALICRSPEMKAKIDHLRNFGFSDDVTVEDAGINSKMDELRSAFGILSLKLVNEAIEERRKVAGYYREHLKGVDGIRFINDIEGVRHNYAYFPVFVDVKRFGKSRDTLFEEFKSNNILARRYFYPAISEFGPYRCYKSANRENLPVTYKLSESVICLPIYAGLSEKDLERVVGVIKSTRYK